jgi:hypothetical protein
MHVDRKLNLTARHRGSFSDQLGRDALSASKRWQENQSQQEQETADHQIAVIARSAAMKQSGSSEGVATSLQVRP